MEFSKIVIALCPELNTQRDEEEEEEIEEEDVDTDVVEPNEQHVDRSSLSRRQRPRLPSCLFENDNLDHDHFLRMDKDRDTPGDTNKIEPAAATATAAISFLAQVVARLEQLERVISKTTTRIENDSHAWMISCGTATLMKHRQSSVSCICHEV